MTEAQEKKIKELKEEWFEEFEKLPPVEMPVCGFSDRVNIPIAELQKKYQEKIRQVMEQEDEEE